MSRGMPVLMWKCTAWAWPWVISTTMVFPTFLLLAWGRTGFSGTLAKGRLPMLLRPVVWAGALVSARRLCGLIMIATGTWICLFATTRSGRRNTTYFAVWTGSIS